MYTVNLGQVKNKKHNLRTRTMYIVAALVVSVGIAYPLGSRAQAAPSASITVNGERSSTLAYGSRAQLSWNASGFKECVVTPGDWNTSQGFKVLTNVTAKQTYTLSCAGIVASATAYATFAVAPPTYQYLTDHLQKSAKEQGDNTAFLKGMLQQIERAEAHQKAGQVDKAQKVLEHTIARTNDLAKKGKLSAASASAYVTAVNDLIASWTAPTPVPDTIPDDVMTLNKPANGGYPAKWANAPVSSMLDDWGMYNRQSVSYVAFKVYQDALAGKNTYGTPYRFWGNPNQWDDKARAAGIPVDTTPTPGSVAISNAGTYGHAMYVEEVGTMNGQPAVYVSQYNVAWDGAYSEGWRRTSGLVFVHF